jgi:hypothetical protein
MMVQVGELQFLFILLLTACVFFQRIGWAPFPTCEMEM